MRKQIILLIIAGIIIFVTGGGFGVFYKTQQSSQQLTQSQAETLTKLQGLASSKVVEKLIVLAYGKVSAIRNNIITLTAFPPAKDVLEIPISQNAKIVTYYFTNVKTGGILTTKEKTITLKHIQVGTTASIDIEIRPDGQFDGVNVRIVPAVNK